MRILNSILKQHAKVQPLCKVIYCLILGAPGLNLSSKAAVAALQESKAMRTVPLSGRAAKLTEFPLLQAATTTKFGKPLHLTQHLLFSEIVTGPGVEASFTLLAQGADDSAGEIRFFTQKGDPWEISVDGMLHSSTV